MGGNSDKKTETKNILRSLRSNKFFLKKIGLCRVWTGGKCDGGHRKNLMARKESFGEFSE